MSIVELQKADYIEFAPSYWKPKDSDEKLAALCGYLTGDGTIGNRRQKYRKKNGEVSVYEKKFAGALYGNHKSDLVEMSSDLTSLKIPHSKIGIKKTLGESRQDGWQIQMSSKACNMFVSSGVPHGKKTTVEFDVPEWIKNGSAGVKRAYLSALFGAEGFTPVFDRSTKGRLPRQMGLTMCKIRPTSGIEYFNQLVKMMGDLGVSAIATEVDRPAFGKPYVNLSISVPTESTLAFMENIGFTYCNNKSLIAWKWSKYIRAYNYEANRRRCVVLEMSERGETFESIGKETGVTRGAAHRLLSDVKRGNATRAGKNFPHFDKWMSDRWNEEMGLLRVNVIEKKKRKKKESVFNVLVSSQDHSYLLANGANNYNSFETMSGRVYYPFDRKIHVGKYPFNPKLPIYIGQDFNIDPMSSIIFQIQSDGEVWVVDEIILFGSNTEETCNEIEKRYWRHMKNIIVYPDPAGGARQHARGETDLDIFREKNLKKLKYHRKHPAIADRVNSVNRMLRSADGEVRLRVDERCKHMIDSFEQTIYKEGSREIDKSMSVEHACFHGDQVVIANGVEMKFRDIPKSGTVMCHDGLHRGYTNGGKIKNKAPMLLVILSNGVKIKCTDDHKFLTTDGWIQALDIEGKTLCNQELLAKLFRSSMATDIICAKEGIFKKMAKGFTEWYGRKTLGIFQMATTYITSTIIDRTMQLKTSWLWKGVSMSRCISERVREKFQKRQERRQQSGTEERMEKSGTSSSMGKQRRQFKEKIKDTSAFSAARSSLAQRLRSPCSAQKSAKQSTEEKAGWMTRQELASLVISHLKQTDIQGQSHVAGGVRTLSVQRVEPSDSYCLTVDGFGMFEVGGVVASNCDAAGYMLEYEFPIRKLEVAGISI